MLLKTEVYIAGEDKSVKPDGGSNGTCESNGKGTSCCQGCKPSGKVGEQGADYLGPAISFNPLSYFSLHTNGKLYKGIKIAGMFGSPQPG